MIHWRDGEYAHGGVTLSLDSDAFRFGTGLFETLYYNGQTLCHLKLHLNRLHGSLEHLSIKHVRLNSTHLTEIISKLLHSNNLLTSPSRINIYCFPDASGNTPCSVLVTARPHIPAPGKTLRLAIWPDHHLTPLAQHKTMNYDFCNLAQRQAMAAGFDGALLTDNEGNILETTTSALVFMSNHELITPASQPRLPSTALAIAKQVLNIHERVINLDEASNFDHAYALSSLMGMRPVIGIGEQKYMSEEDACQSASKLILCS